MNFFKLWAIFFLTVYFFISPILIGDFKSSFVTILAENMVEINTASLEELDKITGVGPVLAQRIVNERPFSSVDDLLRVKGIGEKTLKKIKDQGLAYVQNQEMVANQPQESSESATAPIAEPELATDSISDKKIYPSGIFINEILPSPDGPDETDEFIELLNTNNFSVNLSGWKIEDLAGITTTYIFPENAEIPAYGYLTLNRLETKITLNNDEDGLNLIKPNNEVADFVGYKEAIKNQSYNKIKATWQWSSTPTPSVANIIKNYTLANQADGLSKQKKSDNNIATASVQESVNLAEGYDKIEFSGDNPSGEVTPWALFIISTVLVVISGGIILFIKFKEHI
jgi:competence ComEA-like helix-hairpin-helix protein